jgi:L-lactate dehydrogenase complex protein LldE
MIIDLFVTCTVDLFKPQIAMAAIKVLESIGCNVNYPIDQTCCGFPAYQEGYWEDAKNLGTKFIKEFQGDRMVVTLSTNCAGMVCQNYPQLFENTSLHIEHKTIVNQVIEFTEFLGSYLEFKKLGSKLSGNAVFIDSCAGLRECGLKKEARTLLNHVSGLKLLELENGEECCGGKGNFTSKFEELAQEIGLEKIEKIKVLNPDFVIANELSCLAHLENIWPVNSKPQFLHIAEVLASGI